MIRFFVAGLPKSMSVGTSFGFKRNGVEHHMQGRRNTDWSTLVGQIGRDAWEDKAPLMGGLSFSAYFYLPKPGSAKKTVRLPLKRPDLDNLMHKLTDQFKGVFWLDDSQICDVHGYKRFACDRPDGRTGVEICVEPVHLAEVVVPQQPTLTPA